MENVINQILDIDEKARAMIAEAEEKKQEILKQAHESEGQIKDEFIEKAKAKAVKVEEAQKIESDEKIAEIEQMKQEKIQLLDKTYNDNQEQWKNEIIKNVIGM